MKLPSLLLLLALLASALFAVLNWAVIVTPAELSLGVTSVQMPLGLVMLGLLVFVAALFLLYIVYLQATALLDARHLVKEARSSRDLAQQAEISRLTELRLSLLQELTELRREQGEAVQALHQRLAAMERSTQDLVEQQANSLAASIGELEDRMQRAGTAAPDRG